MDEKRNTPKEGASAPPLVLHAIQLMVVQPTELSIRVAGDPSEVENFEGVVKLEAAHSAYDEDEKTIHVRVRAIIDEAEDVPLAMRVEIVGVFKVDESRFDRAHVLPWARTNAPMVLYPFLREQVFSLSQRVGARGFIVPLIEVPTFKIVQATT